MITSGANKHAAFSSQHQSSYSRNGAQRRCSKHNVSSCLLLILFVCFKTGSHFVAQAALAFSCLSFPGVAMKGMHLHALLIYLARVGICVWCWHKPICAGTHTCVLTGDWLSQSCSITYSSSHTFLWGDVVSLCSLVWPRTGYVDQAGIKLIASASRAGIKGMCHHTWLSLES